MPLTTERPTGDHLDHLEAEAIDIVREAASAARRAVLLFSGGKDSAVLLDLACAAFAPDPLPFPLLHVDTGRNFPEVREYIRNQARSRGCEVHVASVPDAIESGAVAEEGGTAGRNRLQTPVLKAFLTAQGFDVVFGGARRDEDKARAKERVFSVREADHSWRPESQRPELWGIYNPDPPVGGSMRVFPLSNWTELDIWHYVRRREVDLPELYYAHLRDIVVRDGMLVPISEFVSPDAGEQVVRRSVRFRTVGDATCTAAIPSTATDLDGVLEELLASTSGERAATRMDDRADDGAAMEVRKRAGYF